MQENIKTLTFGCRLNALESEKIANMIAPYLDAAIIVNTCSVTAEAERQCGQAIRRAIRENPNVPVFITGCGATRAPDIFGKFGTVVTNKDKMDLNSYIPLPRHALRDTPSPAKGILSKAFIQIQNGCNWQCTYCITRIVRGPAVSFSYDEILADVRAAVANGFAEIVLTGIDIASFKVTSDKKQVTRIHSLCERLLDDVPGIQRLRLSSMDPASREIPKIIELMKRDSRMMPHLHLSMQSGANPILGVMRRRHNAEMVRRITNYESRITFSWDIICGFPSETDELFADTVALARQLRPIKIHAFPFSPRPGTAAADMPNQVPRAISKQRVKIISQIADENLAEFMATQIGTTTTVLVENNNIARTPDDIELKIIGAPVPNRTICDIEIIGIEKNIFIGKVKL